MTLATYLLIFVGVPVGVFGGFLLPVGIMGFIYYGTRTDEDEEDRDRSLRRMGGAFNMVIIGSVFLGLLGILLHRAGYLS